MRKQLDGSCLRRYSNHIATQNRKQQMNVAQQAAKYAADLSLARRQLVAVQTFDITFLRASRIAQLADYIGTLEMLVHLCEEESAQQIEDMAAAE